MEDGTKENYRILNRDTIKYMAAFFMFLSHFSLVLMRQGSFVADVFENIGYFTAITMCYFLVEGFYCTRSRRRYACRLCLFGFISEIPYLFTIVKWGSPETAKGNMMFSLLICFLMLLALETISNEVLLVLAIGGLFCLSLTCDWALLAPGFTILFWWSYGLEKETKIAFVVSIAMVGIFHLPQGILNALGSMIGAALSGTAVIYFYNGKRIRMGQKFSKWFFYWFYPLHLLILALMRFVEEQGRF